MFSPFLVGGVWRVLDVGVGASGCSCCFLGVPGGGGVFSLQYGVLWVACLLVLVPGGVVGSLMILL